MARVTYLMFVGLIALGAGPGDPARAGGPAEDDLAVVRRAVAEPPTRAPRPESVRAPEPPKAQKGEPQWLRVRIKEKNGKSTVSVNLPLALARALGEDLPLDLTCRKGNEGEGRAKVRLGDVLASLDSGQDIVQVDGEDGSVRVWVE
jgi:Mrp family chromosome partitioning ATPase